MRYKQGISGISPNCLADKIADTDCCLQRTTEKHKSAAEHYSAKVIDSYDLICKCSVCGAFSKFEDRVQEERES